MTAERTADDIADAQRYDDAPVDVGQPADLHEPMDATPSAGDIVVAVGDDELSSALAYAVAEARARSVGLHLVHVVRLPSADGISLAEVWAEAVARGRGLLVAATTLARALGGADLRVSCNLAEHRTVAGSIVEQGRRAEIIVVQHRHLGRLRRVVTHSVTNAVAAHAEAPVVAVPTGWSPGPTRTGWVVVGIQDLVEARALLDLALAEAARRGLPLWVVHAGASHTLKSAALIAIVHDARTHHPQVHVDNLIEDAPPARLLVNPMTAADLLVLGRRHHALRPGSHLGPVARAVLDEATCPVMLVKVVPDSDPQVRLSRQAAT